MIRAAVLGKPIEHSLSPLVHGLIYTELGIDHDYRRYEMDEHQAGDLIRTAFARGDEKWNGFSLTMPLKEVGFSLELPIDVAAQAARSINTITPSGSFNTDIPGLVRVMKTEGIEVESVVILGNGATARSTLIALDSFATTKSVTLFRRSEGRDHLLPKSERFTAQIRNLADFSKESLREGDLVVSTLPATSQRVVASGFVDFRGTLVDFSYAPWPSVLAEIVSAKVISGLPILVSQAVDQAALFSGLDFDRDEMYRKVLLSTVRSTEVIR